MVQCLPVCILAVLHQAEVNAREVRHLQAHVPKPVTDVGTCSSSSSSMGAAAWGSSRVAAAVVSDSLQNASQHPEHVTVVVFFSSSNGHRQGATQHTPTMETAPNASVSTTMSILPPFQSGSHTTAHTHRVASCTHLCAPYSPHGQAS
jgi:hypothetical protein